MPNREVHVRTSGAAGTLFASRQARDEPEAAQIMELLGGIAGGIAGGRMPDLLDPPLHPGAPIEYRQCPSRQSFSMPMASSSGLLLIDKPGGPH